MTCCIVNFIYKGIIFPYMPFDNARLECIYGEKVSTEKIAKCSSNEPFDC